MRDWIISFQNNQRDVLDLYQKYNRKSRNWITWIIKIFCNDEIKSFKRSYYGMKFWTRVHNQG